MGQACFHAVYAGRGFATILGDASVMLALGPLLLSLQFCIGLAVLIALFLSLLSCMVCPASISVVVSYFCAFLRKTKPFSLVPSLPSVPFPLRAGGGWQQLW